MNRTLLTAISLALTLPAAAQMDNVVEVESSYRPVIKDANKIDVKPDEYKPSTTHYPVEYSRESQPLNRYTFRPISASSSDVATQGAKCGFATVAGGNDGNLLGKAAYGLRLTDNDDLDLSAGISGHNANIEHFSGTYASKVKSRFYSAGAGATFRHKLAGESALTIGLNYGSQAFNYQSALPYSQDAMTTTDKQHNTLGAADIALSPYSLGRLSVGASAGYKFFNQKYETGLSETNKESLVWGGVNLSYDIGQGSSAGIGLDVKSYGYANNDFDNNTLFTATPHVSFSNDEYSLHIGAKLTGTSGLESKLRIAPDVKFSYSLSSDAQLYAEATGGVEANDFRSLSAMSPYWALGGATAGATQLANRFDMLNATGGITVNAARGLHLDLSVGYDMSKNRAELCPLELSGGQSGSYGAATETATSQVFTADGNRLRVNGTLEYRYKDIVDLNLSNQYNVWTIDDNAVYKDNVAWRPALELRWKATFKVYSTLRAGLSWNLATFKDDDLCEYKRPDTNDLGAEVSYTLPIGLTVYAQGDNLLGKKYDNYFGYKAAGANFIVGAALTF